MTHLCETYLLLALNGAIFTDATLTEATLEGANLEQIGSELS
ncbi:MAG: hypothetical protein BRC48_13715 [Cyanobacteria bacterium QS_9_48_30]|nr:MAG: hypothetical protein BRC48_13715 [Cyanobacteria bacterium QS_9_48_30]